MVTSTTTLTVDDLRPLVVEVPIRIDWLSGQNRLGERRSVKKGGTGREYCDFKPYRPGDDVRRINWKIFGRRPNRPVVTLFEEERTANICVLTDVSTTMDMVSVSLSKRELAAVLTASVLKSAARTSDHSQFTAFTRQRVVRHLTRRASRRLTRMAPAIVLDEQPEITSTEIKEPNLGLASAVRKLPNTRSLVFIVSDFNDLTDIDLDALSAAGSAHEVVCLVVQDLRERELPRAKLLPFLPLPGLYTVYDAAGRQQTIVTTSRTRRKHAERFAKAEALIFEKLEGANCKFATMRTEETPDERRRKLTSILQGRRGAINLNLLSR